MGLLSLIQKHSIEKDKKIESLEWGEQQNVDTECSTPWREPYRGANICIHTLLRDLSRRAKMPKRIQGFIIFFMHT
jgi:hypothetical protein